MYELGQNALPPLGVLGLDSGCSTARPSRPDTPRASGLRPALYLCLRRIGSGVFGDVDEVINLRNGTSAARKQLRAFVPRERHKRKHDESMTQFENEVKLMRTAKHVNVMRVIDVVLVPQPTLYMPFFEAGSMEDHRNELSEEQTVCILRQLLIGTAYLHEENIVHRDLKPANVLLDLRGNRIRAVITDLGLSKMLTGVDTASVCGTRIYMAPEVGSERYGPQVDEYAIGIMAMEFVYGLKEVPHPPGSAEWKKAQHENVEDLDDDQLSEIVIGLTDQRPRTRLTANACLDLGCKQGLWKKENGVVVDAVEVEAVGLTLRLWTLSPSAST